MSADIKFSVINLFPTPVLRFELNRALTKEEIEFATNIKYVPNTGNFTSEDNDVLFQEPMRGLREFAEDSIAKYLKYILQTQQGVALRITQSWLNLTMQSQYHHLHEHPNSYLSGVIYIKADRQKDQITFYHNKYEQIKMPVEAFNVYNSPSWWLETGAGDLFLFPSSLRHGVNIVKGEDRISLAFNTFPVGYIGNKEERTELILEK